MRIRLLAFARVREVVGSGAQMLDVPDGSTAGDVWRALCARYTPLQSMESSTRLARNGRIGGLDERLHDGDELALLPPAGGG